MNNKLKEYEEKIQNDKVNQKNEKNKVALSSLIIIESVWSSLVLLYLSIFHADQSGDAANLRNATHVPAFVWALLFVSFSLWMAYCSAAVVNGMITL